MDAQKRVEEIRRRKALAKLEYDLSFSGNVSKTLTTWYLKIFLPICLLVTLYESLSNREWTSTHIWWRQHLTIPDMVDFLNFEIPMTASH